VSKEAEESPLLGAVNQATASEDIEDFMCAVVTVICKVWKLLRVLQLFVVTSYKPSINPIFNPNPESVVTNT
jgi:hypothetical protein